MKEINDDREEHGKKPFDDHDEDDHNDKPYKPNKNTSKKKLARRKKMKTVTKNTTDPESGLFVKGDRKRQFAYESMSTMSITIALSVPNIKFYITARRTETAIESISATPTSLHTFQELCQGGSAAHLDGLRPTAASPKSPFG